MLTDFFIIFVDTQPSKYFFRIRDVVGVGGSMYRCKKRFRKE